MDILILILLQIKHWYADFKIQTYMQTVKKGVWLDLIGVSHTLDHMWCTMLALLVASWFFPISATSIIVVALVEGIYHYMVDFTKVKFGCKDNTKPLFWNQFGLDQLAHQLSYLAIVWYLVA
jgi:Protein of unknown function (DUF3307)